MTILTLVCSNSTTGVNPAAFVSNFRITLPHSIPVRRRCKLISATCLQSTDAGGRRLLSVRVPWLQSAECVIIGSSSNALAAGVSAAALAHDKERQHDRDLLLTFPARASQQLYRDFNLTINTSTIPRTFEIQVRDGATGSPVGLEIKYLILKLLIEPIGLY